MTKPTPADQTDGLRALLEVVLDALTLPYSEPDYDRRILDRAAIARVTAREALAEDPTRLAWNADWLRSKLAEEQAESDEREKNRCRRCRTPFDPADTRSNGAGRYASTPWCRACITNCRDGHAEHVCGICEPTRYGAERP